MKRNVGGLDERVRKTLGPLLLALSVASLRRTGKRGRAGEHDRTGEREGGPRLALVGLAVGAILTVTGLTGRCPANSVLGRNTARGSGLSEEAREVRDRALK